MAALSMQLLGMPCVLRDGAPVGIPPSLQQLLGYLCVEPESHCHRERVVEALWPDMGPEVGRRRLNTAVWRARALFGAGRDEVLQVSRSGTLHLDRCRIEVDVVEALLGLGEQNRGAAARGDQRALELLAAGARIDPQDFLVGCCDDWVCDARTHLEAAVLSALDTLVHASTIATETIAWSELLLRRDPLREDMHRLLIRLYAETGRRPEALRQYDSCQQVLRAELGVEPLVETALLAAAVRAGVPPLSPGVPDLALLLRELSAALATCRTAADQIERAITLFVPD